MKLYFYELDKGDFKAEPKGVVAVGECEVIEKETKYYSADGKRLPGYGFFVRKSNIGKIVGCDYNRIALTEQDFEYAKNEFRKLAEWTIKQAKEEVIRYENVLRAINESEE